ncbi:MAG: hypothetical protein ACKOQY_12410, partial [Bacteroidota bacterium]
RKRLAEIESKKASMSGGSVAAPKKPSNDISTYRFDFDRQFIAEGITTDTIVETNRTILRSIVNSSTTKATYIRVTTGYGVFYFKNSQSITENMYNLEMEGHRKQIGK